MRLVSDTLRSRGLPAAILLAGHAGTAPQAETILAPKCHRLPGCRESPVATNLHPVGHGGDDADSPWE